MRASYAFFVKTPGASLNCEIFLSSLGVANLSLIRRECEAAFLSVAALDRDTAGPFFGVCFLVDRLRVEVVRASAAVVAGTLVFLEFVLLLARSLEVINSLGCNLNLSFFFLLGARALWRARSLLMRVARSCNFPLLMRRADSFLREPFRPRRFNLLRRRISSFRRARFRFGGFTLLVR